jgi:hypothetical protein
MPSLESQKTIESLTPEIIGQELCTGGLVDSPKRLHLEFIRRNPERQDYLRRASVHVFVDGIPNLHLTIGHNLSNVRDRSQAFADACPEIACRPVFWHQADGWDYLGFEHFDGRNLDSLSISGRLTAQEAVSHCGRIVAALERTIQQSSIGAAAQEIEAFFARVLSLPVFGGFDRAFLQEIVFPFIRDRALTGPCRTRWTNGDLVARNVLADPQGNVRLVDYEFAARTHFFAEDWWRWRSFSQLPPEALDLPALRSALPAGNWLEAFFILRQLCLAYETNCTHLVVVDSRAGFDRLIALAAAENSGFRSSVFLRPFADAMTTFVGTSPAKRAAREIITARISWSIDGKPAEEHTESLDYPAAQDTSLHFVMRSSQGRLQCRLIASNSAGLLKISSICIRTAESRTPPLLLTEGGGWDRIQLADSALRLVDTPELNLLVLNEEACLQLPECELGTTPCDVLCEIRLRFAPDLTALPNYLRTPFTTRFGSPTPSAGAIPTRTHLEHDDKCSEDHPTTSFPDGSLVSPNPGIVVSSLFFFREDLADEFIGTLVPQLAHAAANTGLPVRLVLTLNFPFTPSVWQKVIVQVATLGGEGVTCELVERGYNLGFGASHNFVFNRFPSDVFIALNNDVFCEQNDWLTAMAQRLGPHGDADLVGPVENSFVLRASDACGWRAPDPKNADFLTGSLLGVRSSTARRLGLFAEQYRFCYFEDSDLGLRYRQAGAKTESIPVPHRHIQSASAGVIPRHVISNLMDINRCIFFAKWSGYLTRRNFTRRCGADLRALAAAGCVDALPALLALTRDHPATKIEIYLPDDAPQELFWHPNWSILPNQAEMTPADFDRIWVASPSTAQDHLPAPLVHARSVGTGFPESDVVAYFNQTVKRLIRECPEQPAESRLALIVATLPPPRRQGLVPHAEFFLPTAQYLRSRGYSVIWAVTDGQQVVDDPGKKRVINGWADWLSNLQAASLIVTPAGIPLTLAQFLGRPTFAVCGAVLPDRAIWAWTTTGSYTVEKLSCLGCCHLWGRMDRGYCMRLDEACIHPSGATLFAKHLGDFLEKNHQPDSAAMIASQRAQMTSYLPAPELELNRWTDD